MGCFPTGPQADGSRGTATPSARVATPSARAPQMLLLLGEEDASDWSGMMGTEEGKAPIAAEKGAAAPTKLEAGAKDSLLAPSQFTVPSSNRTQSINLL